MKAGTRMNWLLRTAVVFLLIGLLLSCTQQEVPAPPAAQQKTMLWTKNRGLEKPLEAFSAPTRYLG